MKAFFRHVRFCAPVLLLGLGIAGMSAAQAPDASRYPVKPIRLILTSAGGSTEVIARLLAQKMSERLGQQVFVDTRAGASGIIGNELAARSTADGYTLLVITNTYTQIPAILNLSYDPVKSLAPIAQLAMGPNSICSHPNFVANSAKDLITLARARPGEVRYASTGIGGSNHFAGELFNQLARVTLDHIPYKGGGEAILDVMTGRIEVMFGSVFSVLPQIRSGKLKPLGVGSPKRSPLLPQVPAIAETVPGYDGSAWWGVLTPAGVPATIVNRLNSEINAILRDPDMAKRLTSDAAEPVAISPEAFGKFIVSEIAKWSRIAKQANIRAE